MSKILEFWKIPLLCGVVAGLVAAVMQGHLLRLWSWVFGS